MLCQTIYQRVSSVLAALLLTSSLALSFNVQAAQTDYDGVWDVNFSCGSPQSSQRDFAIFKDVIVKNGQGSFADQGPQSNFTGTLSFQNGSIVITRRSALRSDPSVFWTLKVEGNLFDPSTFNLIGVLNQNDAGMAIRDCLASGVLRKPDSVSLASSKPASVKPKPSTTAALIEYDGRWTFTVDCIASKGNIRPHKFEMNLKDGDGVNTWQSGNGANEYKVTIQDNKFIFVRTESNILDSSQVWQMKVAGEMMSKTRLQAKGMINALFRDGGPSECMVTGYR